MVWDVATTGRDLWSFGTFGTRLGESTGEHGDLSVKLDGALERYP
jgi:hypothetical protein